jgi:UDP-N-acetylglucosamine--N-acetylmuramyl-(pentapeptide) pyrophosphoryl-undecaprenol N-acetylglucosamine transferase
MTRQVGLWQGAFMRPRNETVVFAGGGSGGHVFPNIAILERLRESALAVAPLFLLSERPLDRRLAEHDELPFHTLPVRPLTSRPWHWPRFYLGWVRSVSQCRRLFKRLHVTCVVATGGFVSGPAMAAARRVGVPSALVNLDAVPGRANRYAADLATTVFSVYPTPQLPQAFVIGMPLRRSVLGHGDARAARRALGLDPTRETLLVTGASQGASSFNRLMIEMTGRPEVRQMFRGGAGKPPWQVFHLAGVQDIAALNAAYHAAGVPARVDPFCHEMGLAWSAASIAVSRAGAGSVAEVWANATPTIFLPYPFHRDQHQRLNAAALTDAGAALMFQDQVDPEANARALAPRLLELMASPPQRQAMADKLRATRPPDGAAAVADWILQRRGGVASRQRTAPI